jgi:hypothetical protein
VEELYQAGVVNWPPLIGPRQNNLKPSSKLLSRTPHFISTPSTPPSDPIYESLQFELCCLPKNPRSPLGCEELVIGIGQSDTRATRTSSKWTARLACAVSLPIPAEASPPRPPSTLGGSDCRANLCSDPQAQGNEMQEVCSIAQG